MSINVCALGGNCTRDAESRQLQSGSTVIDFGIAVNERRRNPQTNEWDEVPNFFDVSVFSSGDRRTQFLMDNLRKGAKVTLQGRLRYSSWQDKSGQRRSKVDVVAEEIEFLSQRQGGPQQGNYPRPRQNAAPTTPQGPQTAYQQYPQPNFPQQPQQVGMNQAPMPNNAPYDPDLPF